MANITATGTNNIVDSAMQEAIQALYAKKNCCSQVLALLILGAQGKENPGLVRALAGLCHGVGRTGSTCGIMTGGVCVLSYLLGRQEGEKEASPGAQIVIDEYVRWFEEAACKQWGSIRCTDILGEESATGPNRSHCMLLLAQAWIRILGILCSHRISYGIPKKKMQTKIVVSESDQKQGNEWVA